MEWINKSGYRRVLYAIITLAAVLLAMAPMTVRATDNALTITVNQVFTTSSPSADDTFTYILKPLDPDNPMPGLGRSLEESYVFTIAGNGSAKIGPIFFNRQGIYEYELYQVVESEEPGYTYDMHVYTIEGYVDDLLNVEAIVLNTSFGKAVAIEFQNFFDLSPNDPFLMLDPPVKKTVTGNPGKDSMFTFKLTAKDPASPMPAGSVNGVKTIQIAGSGQGEFGTWSYTKTGVYYYTVSEVNTGESGYTYDKSVYTITDTVTEADGQLMLSRVVTNSSNKQVTSLTFINKYSRGPGGPGGPDGPGGHAPGASADVSEKPSGPKTGDSLNTAIYNALFITGGLVVLGAAVYLIAAGKRRKADTVV